MGCKWWIWGLFLLSLNLACAEVVIDEVMYDYPGTDTKHEWLEINNNGSGSVNLTNWKLKEGGSNHGLTLISGNWLLEVGKFAVIADDALTFRQDYFAFNSTLFDSAFTSGLSGSGEELSLIDAAGNVNYSIFYNTSLGAAGNGLTLCIFNGTWQECLATPGEENKINISIPINDTNSTNTTTINLKLSAYLSSPVYVGNTYNNLFKLVIEEKDNCSAKDTILVGYNITRKNYFTFSTFSKEIGCSSYANTGKFTPPSAGNYTICGQIVSSTVNESVFFDNSVCFNVTAIDISSVSCEIGLNVILDDTIIYQQGQSLSYAFALSNETFPFTLEYWIEDLFSKIVKSKYNTTNTNSKTWKADISEEDRVLYLKARLYPKCKDQNLSDNYAQKMFIVTNEGALQKINDTNSTDNITSINDSSIIINKITPTEPDWGEALRAEVEIHKGNTNKYAVSAWVEIDGNQVSEVTKINLYSKYTNYKLALPLLMDLRCEEEAQEAVLVMEGLDQRAEQEVTIAESSTNCGEETTSTSSADESSTTEVTSDSGNEDVSYELLDLPSAINPGQILNFKVKFKGDEWDHFFQTYGYVYRGSRCYSCEVESKEREDYLQEFMLGFGEEKVVDYSLPLDGEMEPGEYKLKVRVHKDGQITAKSVDTNITIGDKEEEKSMITTTSTLSKAANSKESPSLNAQRTILNQSKFLVYESSNEKAKKLIPYILVIVFGLLCVILMKERWGKK